MTDTGTTRPRSILFACNQNAVRSPMAEALANAYFRRRVFVDSVGLIAGKLDPFSVVVMGEQDIDIAAHTPKTLSDINLADYDRIVALTPESYEKIGTLIQGTGQTVDYWLTHDPSDAEGNRNQVLDSYRLVRDHLECRIADSFPFEK